MKMYNSNNKKQIYSSEIKKTTEKPQKCAIFGLNHRE
jgi:hypothetical protein